MKAVVTPHKGKYEIKGLKITLDSLEKHGFDEVFFSGDPDHFPEHQLIIPTGFQIEELTRDGRVFYNFQGFLAMMSENNTVGAVIKPAPETNEPEIWVQLKSEDEKSLSELADKYKDWFEVHYRLGMLYLKQKMFKESFDEFQIARHHKSDIKYELGYVKEWRDHGLDFNQGLCAYYAGEMDWGRFYVDRVIMKRDVSGNLVDQSYRNYEFYVKPLEIEWTKEYMVSDYDVPEDIKSYKSLNPSLLPKGPGEFYLNIRIVNWHVNPVGFNQYTSPHPKNKFKTKNLLGVINPLGGFVSQPQLIKKADDMEWLKIRKHHIDGFEDCRLFWLGENRIYFISNCTKNNPSGAMKLSVGQIDVTEGEPQYRKLTPIQGVGDDRTQKNWLIYKVSEGYAWAIYGYDPLTIVKINLETGQVEIESEARLPIRSGEFRGSAGPLKFKDGYLLVIHQVYLKGHGGRRYLHRFLFLDADMIPVGMSEMWYLKSKDIEYVSTMADTGDDIIIGYGMCDRCACLSAISKSTISKMIHPITEYL